MAYDISDRQAAVRQVQEYLREISRHDPDITKVYPDGIYDENTAAAVGEFQRKHGLDDTCTVDKDTFDLLRETADKIAADRKAPEKADVFSGVSSGEISYGERFDSVYILQVMLCLLADFYGFEKAEINGCFDDLTENAVFGFQKAHGLDPTGSVDRKTWDEIAKAYNRYVHKIL